MKKGLVLILLVLMMIGLVAATFAGEPGHSLATTMCTALEVDATLDASDQDVNLADEIPAAGYLEGGTSHVSN